MEGRARWDMEIGARLYKISRFPFKFFSRVRACLHCFSVLLY